jgi:hypothetical protein
VGNAVCFFGRAIDEEVENIMCVSAKQVRCCSSGFAKEQEGQVGGKLKNLRAYAFASVGVPGRKDRWKTALPLLGAVGYVVGEGRAVEANGKFSGCYQAMTQLHVNWVRTCGLFTCWDG